MGDDSRRTVLCRTRRVHFYCTGTILRYAIIDQSLGTVPRYGREGLYPFQLAPLMLSCLGEAGRGEKEPPMKRLAIVAT